MPNYHQLIDVFEKAREYVLRDDNDFSWSGWDGVDEAIEEVDAILATLRNRRLIAEATILFLPTGPLQELSLSSGWGDEFIALANWFDEARDGVDCTCYSEPLKGFGTAIGTDARYADIFLVQCPICRRSWLRYQYELEFYSNSGRWFLGPLRKDAVGNLNAEAAAGLFNDMLWYFAGGSYFDGKVRKMSGVLPL